MSFRLWSYIWGRGDRVSSSEVQPGYCLPESAPCDGVRGNALGSTKCVALLKKVLLRCELLFHVLPRIWVFSLPQGPASCV